MKLLKEGREQFENFFDSAHEIIDFAMKNAPSGSSNEVRSRNYRVEGSEIPATLKLDIQLWQLVCGDSQPRQDSVWFLLSNNEQYNIEEFEAYFIDPVVEYAYTVARRNGLKAQAKRSRSTVRDLPVVGYYIELEGTDMILENLNEAIEDKAAVSMKIGDLTDIFNCLAKKDGSISGISLMDWIYQINDAKRLGYNKNEIIEIIQKSSNADEFGKWTHQNRDDSDYRQFNESSNSLKDAAEAHLKKQKGLSPFINRDAGDVEKGVEAFNNNACAAVSESYKMKFKLEK